jgi:hypothetical protein
MPVTNDPNPSNPMSGRGDAVWGSFPPPEDWFPLLPVDPELPDPVEVPLPADPVLAEDPVVPKDPEDPV